MTTFRPGTSMLPDFFSLRNLTLAVLACTVSLMPFASARPHPNHTFFTITTNGAESCILSRALLENLARVQEFGCSAASGCGSGHRSTMPDPRSGAASPCGGSPCAERVPKCPESRGCCVRVQLNSQPLLAQTDAAAQDARFLLGLMVPGDEDADCRNLQPPVPPPRSC